MKSWFDYLKYILSGLFLVSMACSCTRNEDLKYNGETATLSLNIPMLQSSSRAGIKGTPEEDAIHHLRVVILSQGAKESINKVFTKSQIEASNGNITIDNVPVGEVQMYVIANEAALGRNYDDLSVLQGEVDQNLKKVLIKDEARAYFPKRGSEFSNENSTPETTKGFPMTWLNKTLTINPPQYEGENIKPQEIQVALQRCVSKLNITMTNVSTEEDIVIKDMNFGAFFGDRLYLFQEENLDVPRDANYVKYDYSDLKEPEDPTKDGITIPKNNGQKSLVLYIYPSFAWTDGDKASPYTIGFKTMSGLTYAPQYFMNDHSALNSIARNTQINIEARLSKSKVVDLLFSVEPWTEITVDVPSFD